jgi:hypothetical protein
MSATIGQWRDEGLISLMQEKAVSARPKEYCQLGKLVDRAFPPKHGEFYGGATIERRLVEILVRHDSNFRPQNLRLVEAEGQIVSMMMLTERELRFDSVWVGAKSSLRWPVILTTRGRATARG